MRDSESAQCFCEFLLSLPPAQQILQLELQLETTYAFAILANLHMLANNAKFALGKRIATMT